MPPLIYSLNISQVSLELSDLTHGNRVRFLAQKVRYLFSNDKNKIMSSLQAVSYFRNYNGNTSSRGFIYFSVYSVGIPSSLRLLSSDLFMLLFMYFRLIDHWLKQINMRWRRSKNTDCFPPGGCCSITNLETPLPMSWLWQEDRVGSLTERTVSSLMVS